MAAQFTGRNGNMLFFTEGERGVIVDAEYGVVVASGRKSMLEPNATWTAGEFSEIDLETANTALATMDSSVSAPTGRLYTIPRGVQNEAKKALSQFERFERGGTDVSIHTAGLLASGGQISFNKLRHVSGYFARHKGEKFTHAWEPVNDGPSAARITWGMWGGDSAQKWTTSILAREGEKALTADGIFIPENTPDSSADPYSDAYNLDPDSGPEFLARVRMDGSGIDRLYKIDVDAHVYVWDDSHWDDMGSIDGDIYAYDAALDMGEDNEIVDPVGKTHVVIDPSSAIIVGSRLTQDPFTPISIEDIDADEAALIMDAMADIDWELVDNAMTAAAVPDQTPGQYTPDERSQNATKQMRTSDGRFATEGQRVAVGGSGNGTITQVNTANQTVNVQLDGGGTVTVPAKQVASERANEPAASIPGNPVAIPKVNLTGILAEPRTPINYQGAQLPGTLPSMTSQDLHDMLYNWPAYVAAQRTSFKAQTTRMNAVSVQGQNSTDEGDYGRALEQKTGVNLIKDAYDNPLLASWLRKTNSLGTHGNNVWYLPTFSAKAVTAGAVPPPGQPETPDDSDVQPVYLAIVAPDDPTAVTQLIALVPASTTSNSPMTYTRKDGQWERDPRTMMDLQSATPPPVVPLTSDALQDCMSQVDDKQAEANDSTDPASAPDDDSTVIDGSPITPASGGGGGVAASGMTVDQTLMLLWGPRENLMQSALTAAGGLDRNRGGAEKLRRYWTRGEGAAKIRWNTPGDWTRCFRHLGKYMGDRAKGYCALRHKEMDHMWPGDKRNREMASRMENTFSTDELVSEQEFTDRATTRVRAQMAHDKLRGLIAAVTPDGDPIYGEMPIAGDSQGSAFVIPLLLPIGVESGDGRIIAEDAMVDVRDLPIPLLWQINTASGHDGSVIVGRIDTVDITAGGVRNARGVFDTGVYGQEAERLVREQFLRGVSADMDKFEAQEVPVFAEDEDDEDAPAVISKKQILVNKTRIMAATLVAKPAFQECQIYLIDDDDYPEEDEMIPDMEDGVYVDDADPIEAAALVAAGYVAEHIPVAPPAEWFQDPHLAKPTPLTVTDDGRVFGHIAAWETDHIGLANNIKPPRSRSNYAYFQTGILRTAEGDDLSVGQLTLAGGHASLEFSAREAVKHYDDTASAIADVKAGEDAFGIWVSGGLRPGTTPEQVRVFRASAPSGDWRPIKGKLELVAVCQVNVPGFPVARTMVAGGQPQAIVAAGAATLARLKSDPVAEMQARLAKLEQFTTAELSAKADPILTKFNAIKAERENQRKAELAAQVEALSARVEALSDFGYVSPAKRKKAAANGHAMKDGSFPINTEDDLKKAIKAHGRAKDVPAAKRHIKKRAKAMGKQNLIPDEWSTTVSDDLEFAASEMRDRIASFASTSQEQTEKETEARKAIQEVDPNALAKKGVDADPKYTPKTQPRNDDGKFRLILARLRSNIGVNGNQDILNQIKAAENLHVGDYKAASTAYGNLFNTINKITSGAKDPQTRGTLREASVNLAKAVANLPLPFDDQSQKIRFSDLPPVLQEMFNGLIADVKEKYGEGADKKLTDIKTFMSGGDFYSQSNVSTQINHLTHLLTVKATPKTAPKKSVKD